jgi:hypothetical protein
MRQSATGDQQHRPALARGKAGFGQVDVVWLIHAPF